MSLIWSNYSMTLAPFLLQRDMSPILIPHACLKHERRKTRFIVIINGCTSTCCSNANEHSNRINTHTLNWRLNQKLAHKQNCTYFHSLPKKIHFYENPNEPLAYTRYTISNIYKRIVVQYNALSSCTRQNCHSSFVKSKNVKAEVYVVWNFVALQCFHDLAIINVYLYLNNHRVCWHMSKKIVCGLFFALKICFCGVLKRTLSACFQ